MKLNTQDGNGAQVEHLFLNNVSLNAVKKTEKYGATVNAQKSTNSETDGSQLKVQPQKTETLAVINKIAVTWMKTQMMKDISEDTEIQLTTTTQVNCSKNTTSMKMITTTEKTPPQTTLTIWYGSTNTMFAVSQEPPLPLITEDTPSLPTAVKRNTAQTSKWTTQLLNGTSLNQDSQPTVKNTTTPTVVLQVTNGAQVKDVLKSNSDVAHQVNIIAQLKMMNAERKDNVALKENTGAMLTNHVFLLEHHAVTMIPKNGVNMTVNATILMNTVAHHPLNGVTQKITLSSQPLQETTQQLDLMEDAENIVVMKPSENSGVRPSKDAYPKKNAVKP